MRQRMHSDTTSIPGWLMNRDPAVIRFIFGEQDIRGDPLEIGRNLGKTAVLLGDHLREDETLCASDYFLLPRRASHTSDLRIAAFKTKFAKTAPEASRSAFPAEPRCRRARRPLSTLAY